MKIQGSVAIVTGGAQGIGEQICRALLKRGGKVSYYIYMLSATISHKFEVDWNLS